VELLRWALALLWLQWSLTFSLKRFFLPEMPLVAVILAAALWRLYRGGARRALAAGALVLAAGQLLYALKYLGEYRLPPVIWGAEDPALFLSNQRPGYPLPPYPAYAFIDRGLPPDAKVLILGEARTYYLERAYVDASLIDEHPLAAWLRESRTVEELAARFRAAGVTHVLFAHAEFLRLARAGYPVVAATREQQALLAAFTARCLKPLARDEDADITVFRVDYGAR
jgi:hypothetical protein